MSKIAVLGGTFDPVHKAHLALLHEVSQHTLYKNFILIPASVSNFKKDARPVASDKERFEMLTLSSDDYKSIYPKDLDVNITVSDIELKRGGVSYTYDTIIYLKKRLGISEKIGFIIGDDHISRLRNWYKHEDLKKEVQFIICPRLGDKDIWNELESDLDYVKLDITSTYEEKATDVRKDFIRYSRYLSKSVSDFALKNHIYFKQVSNIEELKNHLKNTVPERRYIHSLGVAETTSKILNRYNLSPETGEWKGFKASEFCGIVHDLAREWTNEELNNYCHCNKLTLDDDEDRYPVLSHGIVSAEIARLLCGEFPEEWKRAVQVHTSGAPYDENLALALFAADFIEPSRVYLTDEKRSKYLEQPNIYALVYAILCDMMEHWKNKENIAPTGKTLGMKRMLEEKLGLL